MNIYVTIECIGQKVTRPLKIEWDPGANRSIPDLDVEVIKGCLARAISDEVDEKFVRALVDEAWRKREEKR